MKTRTDFRRAVAALLSGLVLCGGLSACTPGGDSPDTSASATETTAGSVSETETTGAASTESSTEPAPDTLTLAGGGVTAGIVYEADDAACLYAAYTLRDSIRKLTGAELPVSRTDEDGDTGVRIVLRRATDTAEIGDCGFAMQVKEQTLAVSAPSLAGFDNAFRQLFADGGTGEGLTVPLTYAASGTVVSGAQYSFDAKDFNTGYTNAPFYNDKNDSVAYVCNAMWHMFGAVDDGQSLVYRFGNEPTYFEWMSEKIMWSGDANYINELKGKIQSFPQTENGYMWSWSTYPYWQVGDTYCLHYDGTFRYIAAVYDVISWENSTEFLHATDNSTAGGEYAELDFSRGRTVLELSLIHI